MKKFIFSTKGHYTYEEINRELSNHFTMSFDKKQLINRLINVLSVEEKLDLIKEIHTP